MRVTPETVYQAWDLYQDALLSKFSKYTGQQAQNIVNETRSAMFRVLVPELNPDLCPVGKKMTLSEVEAAQLFLTTLKVEILLNVESVIPVGLQKLGSIHSRNTYGRRLHNFLDWCKSQQWWNCIQRRSNPKKNRRRENEQSPRVRNRYGKSTENRLTDRRCVYPAYSLKKYEITNELQAQLDDFFDYLTNPHRVDRVYKEIKIASASIYLEEILKMLGWFKLEGHSVVEMNLDLLVPRLIGYQLERLTKQEQDEQWDKLQDYVNAWISKFFNFTRDSIGAKSPRSFKFRTLALLSLCKFQYRTEVESASAYHKLPIYQVLKQHDQRIKKQCQQWDVQKQRVVPIDQKWPEPIAGQTALTTLQDLVNGELRQRCSPKSFGHWQLRSQTTIAMDLRNYLMLSFLVNIPARRQEEFRDLKIALSCPIDRPTDIPINGFYHPLPPNNEQASNYTYEFFDNYLFKTYSIHNKVYPDGVWVLNIKHYKTDKYYGGQSIIIVNRRFPDGKCLYDYLEAYLYGWWRADDRKSQVFDWWFDQFNGTVGHWLSLGRGSFNPKDTYIFSSENYPIYKWGYFFVKPRRGTGYNDSEFAYCFSTIAHTLTGKRINPHLVRNIWAVWGFQVGLSDTQQKALAYAMGMDIKTMQRIYESCSPNEKRRPIEEFIDQFVFDVLNTECQELESLLENLANQLLELSNTELKYYEQQFLSN